MVDLKKEHIGDKIYRGAYEYFKSGSTYCEEEFEVYKDKKTFNLNFYSVLRIRVITGEILKINVDYEINKDFVPIKLIVEKKLGKDDVKEIYDFNTKKSILNYFFSREGEDTIHKQIPTGPKFAIASPAACTTMLYLKSKKEDTTSKNFYNLLVSKNQWNFEEVPKMESVAVERVGLAMETIKIGEHTLKGTPYRVYDAFDIETANKEKRGSPPSVKVYLSKYDTIPYLIQDYGTKIQVKYLNSLELD